MGVSDSEQRYKSLFDHNPDAVYSFDLSGHFTSMNTAGADLTGYEDALERNFADMVHPEDLPRVQEHFAEAVAGASQRYECRVMRRDGIVIPLDVTNSAIVVDGEVVGVFGVAKDISERVAAARRLELSKQRYKALYHRNPDPVYSLDLDGRFLSGNEACVALTGYEPLALHQIPFEDIVDPADRSLVHEHFARAKDGDSVGYECTLLRADGGRVSVRVLNIPIVIDGLVVGVYGMAKDITERKAAEAQLERLALTDSLTGLPNRHRLNELLQAGLDQVGEENLLGLLLLDLDGFKDVNDGIGHHAGDLVLQEVARRIVAVLRGGDEVARLGGDEFAVVLPGVGSDEHAIEVATTVRGCLERPFHLDGITVHVGGSIGIAVSGKRSDPGALLKQADVAMYRAKTLACGWAVFESGEDDLATGRLQMVTDLRATVERGDLDVYYQPIIDVRGRRTSSFEALARWHHPEKGTIPPDQFIPLAEQADLIVPLTRLVLRKAAEACAAWRAAGHDVRVAVNLSIQVMEAENPCAMVTEVLARAGLEARHLVLEITESSLASHGERLNEILRSLRQLGVTLVIDDFGTGYSAMSYLKQLPVAELKIDRSFVRDIATDSRDLAIVRSLVGLAHSLSLRVVAEGVESASALQVLTGLGCDFAQGYGIARPMPERDTAGWLAQYPAQPASRIRDHEPIELLVVDGSTVVRTHLAARTAEAGWRVREAASAEEALDEVGRSIPDVVMLDHHMTGMTGMAAVSELRARPRWADPAVHRIPQLRQPESADAAERLAGHQERP